MTQQELLYKLNQLLKPSGYQFRLLGSWASGKVHVHKDRLTFNAKLFTFAILWEIVEGYTSEDNINTVGKENLADFPFILKDALSTFLDDERETVIQYLFDQPMYDYLQEALPEYGITIVKTLTPNDKDGAIYLRAFIDGKKRTFFYISQSRFDFHGLALEIQWIPEDLLVEEDTYADEKIRYIKLFEKCLKTYKRKLIEEEVHNVLIEI